MQDHQTHEASNERVGGFNGGAGFMFLSAAIFGYLGFFLGLTASTASGQYVFMFGLLLWTLRLSAVAFLVSGALTIVSPVSGNALYSITGLLSAVCCVIVGAMDLLDQQYAAAISPILLFLFSAWNGYGSWTGLREVLASRNKPA